MTELEIRGESQSLGHGDVTESLEGGVGISATGEDVTDNVPSNNVKTGLLVSESLNETDREDEKARESNAQKDGPPGELVVPDSQVTTARTVMIRNKAAYHQSGTSG